MDARCAIHSLDAAAPFRIGLDELHNIGLEELFSFPAPVHILPVAIGIDVASTAG
jgi:hypothetical protein